MAISRAEVTDPNSTGFDWRAHFGDDAPFVYEIIVAGAVKGVDGRQYGLQILKLIDRMGYLYTLFYDEWFDAADNTLIPSGHLRTARYNKRTHVGSFDTPEEFVGVLKLLFGEQ